MCSGHSDQPELAQPFAEFMISAQVQTMRTYLQTAVTIDWDQVNTVRAAWNARWNRQVER